VPARLTVLLLLRAGCVAVVLLLLRGLLLLIGTTWCADQVM
jgi:hypothetical protein